VILRERTLQQHLQILLLQGFQHINLTAGEQRADHFKRGVLGSRSDECHRTGLHGIQQRVLLRLAEPVNLIDKEDRCRVVEKTGVLRLINHLPHILHPRVDRAQLVKGSFHCVGNNIGQRGLTHSGRTPENNGGNPARVNHPAQYGSLTDQMFLADKFIEGLWTES